MYILEITWVDITSLCLTAASLLVAIFINYRRSEGIAIFYRAFIVQYIAGQIRWIF